MFASCMHVLASIKWSPFHESVWCEHSSCHCFLIMKIYHGLNIRHVLVGMIKHNNIVPEILLIIRIIGQSRSKLFVPLSTMASNINSIVHTRCYWRLRPELVTWCASRYLYVCSCFLEVSMIVFEVLSPLQIELCYFFCPLFIFFIFFYHGLILATFSSVLNVIERLYLWDLTF